MGHGLCGYILVNDLFGSDSFFPTLVSRFGSKPEALLQRNVIFVGLAVIGFSVQVIGGFLAVPSALAATRYWSPIVMQIVSGLTTVVLLRTKSAWKYQPVSVAEY